MTDSKIEKLKTELQAAEEEIRSAESIWVSAKRRYYKAWEREYDFANDEKRARESVAWQRSARKDFIEAEKRKEKAELRVKAIKEKIRSFLEGSD